jgi:hypothetical protein
VSSFGLTMVERRFGSIKAFRASLRECLKYRSVLPDYLQAS